jgi:hypothetical protein
LTGGDRAVERKLLQIAFARAGLAPAGFGFAAPLLWRATSPGRRNAAR